MIRRLLVALALAFAALPAAATLPIMVVGDNHMDGGGTDAEWHSTQGEPRFEAMLTFLLDRYGKPYDWTSSKASPPGGMTYWLAKGKFPRNPIDTTTAIQSYAGVLVNGWAGRDAYKTTATYGRARVDSVTLTAGGKLPRVPWLALVTADSYLGGGSGAGLVDAAGLNRDSIGVSSSVVPGTATLASPYWGDGSPQSLGAFPMTPQRAFVMNTNKPAGGVRPIVRQRTPAAARSVLNGTPCAWCDSAATFTADTCVIFDRLNAHASGAAILEVALAGSVGQLDGDTIQDASRGAGVVVPDSPDPMAMLMALAHFDSLTGGAVFDRGKLPIRVSLGIYGGFSRSDRRNFGGVDSRDTTALIATLDSVKTLGYLPAVLLANVDSVGTYPSELAWWARWPGLKYTPCSRTGLDTTVAVASRAGLSVDVFGRWRKRIAVGDGTDTSSVSTLLTNALARCDSIFGKANVSRTIWPPDGDWSPINAVRRNTGDAAPMPRDSILLAIYTARGRGIVHDCQNSASEANSQFSPTANPRGYMRGQGVMRFRFDTLGTSGYRDMPAPGYSGHGLFAGRCQMNSGCQWGLTCDTTQYKPYGPFVGDGAYTPFVAWQHEISRLTLGALAPPIDVQMQDWRGLTVTTQEDDVTVPKADALFGVRPSNVILISANDLAGSDRGVTTRNGWWTIKSLKNQFDMVNKLAGFTVIKFDYPENIRLQ